MDELTSLYIKSNKSLYLVRANAESKSINFNLWYETLNEEYIQLEIEKRKVLVIKIFDELIDANPIIQLSKVSNHNEFIHLFHRDVIYQMLDKYLNDKGYLFSSVDENYYMRDPKIDNHVNDNFIEIKEYEDSIKLTKNREWKNYSPKTKEILEENIIDSLLMFNVEDNLSNFTINYQQKLNKDKSFKEDFILQLFLAIETIGSYDYYPVENIEVKVIQKNGILTKIYSKYQFEIKFHNSIQLKNGASITMNEINKLLKL